MVANARFKIYGRVKRDSSGTSEIISSVFYKRYRTRRNHWARIAYPYDNKQKGKSPDSFCKCATGEKMNEEEAQLCREKWELPDDACSCPKIPENRYVEA